MGLRRRALGGAAITPFLRRLAHGVLPALLVLAAGGIAAGCGDEATAAEGGEVPLGMTMDRDPTGLLPKIVKRCNAAHEGKWRIKVITTPPTVDAQREQIIRRLAGKDPSLDIIKLDVIWTAEFSEAGWILDLTKRIEPVKGRYVPAALDTVEHDKRYWAVPVATQVAMLYYRTDLVDDPPETWEELVSSARKVMKQNPGMAGYLWQANQYEGLTVDAMEFIIGANGSVLDESGRKAVLDEGDGALHAFRFMRKLFEDGISPKAVTTFQEEESRQMFSQGKAVYLRNWPYVWSLAQGPDSKVKGRIGAVPLPGFEGRRSAGVLGGANFGISRYSRYPQQAWDAIECVTSEKNMKERLLVRGETPALESVFADPEAQAKVPWLKVMRTALDDAYPRPVTPYYNDVTVALHRTAHEVAAGHMSPEDGVKRADRAIQLAIEGNGEI